MKSYYLINVFYNNKISWKLLPKVCSNQKSINFLLKIRSSIRAPKKNDESNKPIILYAIKKFKSITKQV